MSWVVNPKIKILSSFTLVVLNLYDFLLLFLSIQSKPTFDFQKIFVFHGRMVVIQVWNDMSVT